mmetsp:Transcript_32557/g.89862  ORF Transcript_32557/g.89862 Transcript_32557/m.89862 type:complete len:222 (-) Transcript_32557:37-702(-)
MEPCVGDLPSRFEYRRDDAGNLQACEACRRHGRGLRAAGPRLALLAALAWAFVADGGACTALSGASCRPVARGLQRASSRTTRRGIPEWMDPDAEWSPSWPIGRPTDPVKVPCTFEAVTSLFVHSEPSLRAPLLPNRLIREGTTFSVEEIVPAGSINGIVINFYKPKPSFFLKTRPGRNPWQLEGGRGYYGGDGWVCDTGIMQGKWYLKKLVKRFRCFNSR